MSLCQDLHTPIICHFEHLHSLSILLSPSHTHVHTSNWSSGKSSAPSQPHWIPYNLLSAQTLHCRCHIPHNTRHPTTPGILLILYIYIRMLFIGFSSAFKTNIPQQLVEKLSLLGLNTHTCNYILDLLTERPQSVHISSRSSGTIKLGTATPPKRSVCSTHCCSHC